MKIFIALMSLLFISKSFATEPICKSQAGDNLSLSRYNSNIANKKNPSWLTPIKGRSMDNQFLTYWPNIARKLGEELKSLCSSGVKSEEIISKMYNNCILITVDTVKDKWVKQLYFDSCELAHDAAISFMEGAKLSAECDDKNSISNLTRATKDISKHLEKNESSGHDGSGAVPK